MKKLDILYIKFSLIVWYQINEIEKAVSYGYNFIINWVFCRNPIVKMYGSD